MNRIKHKYFLLSILTILFCLPFTCFATSEDPKPVFFIGEDIFHPDGLVISVNEITKKPFAGGFGNSVKKEDLILNLTLVNNSGKDLTVNLVNDFSLDLGVHHYTPIQDEFARVRVEDITIGAGTQSRVDLTFRINQEDEGTPELIINLDSSQLRIVCDEKLGGIVSGTTLENATKEEIAKAAKILVNAGRLTAAKGLCESVLLVSPNDSQFLLLMAKIYSSVDDSEQTSYYLRKIDVTKMKNAEEAEEAALMAISIGYSDVALMILASFDAAGLLNDDQKALLARAYYYEDQLEPAINILNKLLQSGYSSSKAYFTLGNIHNKKHDNQQAIYYWEKALETTPDYSEALFNIGVGYYKSGDTAKAREYWTKVINSNPDSNTLEAARSALNETDY